MNDYKNSKIIILVVEDDPGDFGLIQAYLHQAGYSLETEHDAINWATSLTDAKTLVEQNPPDLVLLDLNLPDSSSLDTLTGMREALPGVPIIVLSGNADVNMAIAALELGAQDYLVKGHYEHDSIGKAVRHALVRSRLEARLRLFEIALKSTSNAIVITDPDASIEWVNPAFTQLTGYTLEEALGHKPSELIKSGIQVQSFYQSLWSTILSGNTWQGEIINRRKDGALYHEELTISPVLNPRGELTHFVAIKQDISARIAAENKMQQLNADLDATLQALPDLLFELSLNGDYLNVWDNKLELLAVQKEFLLNHNVSEILPPDAAETILSALKDANERGYSHGQIIRLDLPQGESWFELSTSVKAATSDSGRHFIMLSRDITERKQAENTLQKSEARMRAILDNVPYLIWLKDTEGRFVSVNQAFFKTTGLGQIQDVLGKTDLDLWPEHIARKYRADDAEVIFTQKQKLTEEISMDSGEPHWVETFKAPVIDINGNLLGTTGFAQDVTVRKNAEGKIRHLAHYDVLTDLPNRTLLSDRIQQALAIARREKTHMALMFIDLDKFKPINDELGHHVGDLVLKEAAQRMQDCVRESDTVARIGGDEFVVLLPIIEEEQDAFRVAEKIREALNRPFVLVERSLNISSSTGIAVYPKHGNDETQLMKSADSAMYLAKEGGRDCVVLYSPAKR